ncbi:MAG: DUF917 domain-containing protein [Candidatus Bathyarchaeota archaeon]|nr:MAG: DUF917 domain-containing protein [Candidatus Bathyarchaeota archaeon]
MKKLSRQDLIDLVDGAAIFSAGGGGDPEAGYKIADDLVEEGYDVNLLDPAMVPDDAVVINFACVGATSTITYDSEAAVKTFQTLEEYAGREAYSIIPVELGGFNTLAAIDVAARCGIPIVDADGAGRAVPEVHLKVYTIDDIPLAPMAIADIHGENIIVVKEARDSKSAERIARVLATEWDQSAYTARRILTGTQVKTSPILHTLSKSIRIGMLLRKNANPTEMVLKEANGFRLFEGVVEKIERRTTAGFTWTRVRLRGRDEGRDVRFELKAKNEILVAYINGKLAAMAPDIITAVHPETGRCVTAEKIRKAQRLIVLGFLAPKKWRTRRGLELWKDVLQRSNVNEAYVPIEQLTP